MPAIHTATGLKLPRYKEDFLFITYKFGYKKFLRDIDFRNGPVLDVSKAEATWKYLIYAKWNSWLSTLPLADKEAALQMALGQVSSPIQPYSLFLIINYHRRSRVTRAFTQVRSTSIGASKSSGLASQKIKATISSPKRRRA